MIVQYIITQRRIIFRLREEADVVIAASKAEMEREMRFQTDQLMHDIQEARNQLVRMHSVTSFTIFLVFLSFFRTQTLFQCTFMKHFASVIWIFNIVIL